MDCIRAKNAQGFCDNVDILIDTWEDKDGIHIEVDTSPAVNRLNHQLENLRSGLALTNPEE